MMRHNNINHPNHHHHGATPSDPHSHQHSRPVQKVNNFILQDGGQGDLVDYGDDQFNSSSDDEYIDDYYAAATTFNNQQNQNHRQRQ